MKVLILLCCVVAAFASQQCGENQHYEQCGTACPLTCKNYKNPPRFCVLSCRIGCHCDKGFVETEDGRCVRPEECPSEAPGDAEACLAEADPGMCRGAFPMWYYNAETRKCHEFVYGGCQGNANRYSTEEECMAKCGDVIVWNADVELCSLPAETGPCRAYIPSYYFNQATGNCEKFIYGGCGGNLNRFETKEDCHNTCAQKSSLRCPANEHYDSCGTACPLTCDNYRDAPLACILMCNPGCHCDEGLVRNSEGQCVQPEQCPSKQLSSHSCPANEHYEECGTACPLTCDNYQDPPIACILMCNTGCHCDEGYVRNSNGQCVKPSQCKQLASEVCALPTETGPCRAYFVRYHYDQASGECHEFVYGGCQGNGNNFKTKEECHNTCKQGGNNQECPANEHYEQCGTACPLTCDNYQDPPQACIRMCNIGCHCDEGYVRNSHGQCVKPEECPRKQLASEVCSLPTETGPCRAYLSRYHYDEASGECHEFVYGGCGGNGNNFRTKEECHDTCKQQKSGKCPANAHYEECGTACPLTCDNHQNPPKVCVAMCVSGCQCDKGYVLDSQGQCVKPTSCQKCPANAHFEECGTACPLTCDNYQNPPRACVDMCVSGCHCDKGHVRNSQGQCVKPTSCPSSQYGQEWRPDCDKGAETGPCMAYFERYYYDQAEGMCKKFVYGGCGGNRNNFKTEFDCYNKCGAL